MLTLLALALLAAALAGAVWNYVALERDRGRASSQTSLISESERLLSSVKDLETGERGYLLMGTDQYLEPYRDALLSLEERLGALEAAGAATGVSAAKLERLRELVREKRDVAARVVALRRSQGVNPAAALVRTGEGKRIMDNLRDEIAGLQREAEARVAQFVRQDRRRYLLFTALSLGAALLAAAYFAYLAIRRRRDSERSSALLEGVSENAPVGLGFLDAELRFQNMNRTLAAMNDRTLGADIGEQIWAVLPDLREQLEPKLQSVLDSGRLYSNLEVETASLAKPSETRHLLMSFYPLRGRGSGSAVEGVGMVVTDATTRKRVERRLQESEQEFRTLADGIPQFAWMADSAGTIYWYNNRWYDYTGATPEEMRGSGLRKFHHPDHVERVTEHFRRSFDTGKPWEDTFPLRGKDGEFRWFLSRALPIADEAGRIVRWFGTNTDITAQRETEAALAAAKHEAEEANRAKSQFIANMSHELRTPLSAVIGYSEVLQEEIEILGEESLLADARKIEANARHLLGLINDVLDLSKIEAERMELYAETFSAAEMLRDVASTVDALVAKKGNELVVEVSDDLGTMHTDQTKLRQCLINFLSNAAKFTKNGKVTLTASRSPRDGRDWLAMTVSGHRHRHDAGTAGETLRALLPGRRVDHAPLWRFGPGARHHACLRPHAGWRGRGRERVRKGHDIHDKASSRARRIREQREFRRRRGKSGPARKRPPVACWSWTTIHRRAICSPVFCARWASKSRLRAMAAPASTCSNRPAGCDSARRDDAANGWVVGAAGAQDRS